MTWAAGRVLAGWAHLRDHVSRLDTDGPRRTFAKHKAIPKASLPDLKAILAESGSREAFDDELKSVVVALRGQPFWTTLDGVREREAESRKMFKVSMLLRRTKWEDRRDEGATKREAASERGPSARELLDAVDVESLPAGE
jgi:hypothetical protein